jgi:hypothetical protein
MIRPGEHPSFLELDAYAVEGDDTVHQHIESCAPCRHYVESLRAPQVVPDWARSLPKRRGSFAGWFTLLGGAGALVTAALAAFLIAGPPPEHQPAQTQTLSTKGVGPTVVVHLKRGGQVSQWRSGERLRAGDVLRLEISPDGYRRVRVSSPTSSGESILFSGTIEPRRPTLLPLGLQIDAASPTERLRITLEDPAGMPDGRSPRTWEKTLTFDLEEAP